MPRICAVPGCRTHKAYYERGVAMFCFPREPRLLAAWNKACSSDEDLKRPRFACICEKHFHPSDVRTTASGRASLQQGTVPTRFLDGWQPAEEAVSDSVEDFENRSNREAQDETKDPPYVEEVFLEQKLSRRIAPEENCLTVDMFCRMCGMKHEKDNKHNTDNLLDDEQTKALFDLCIIKNEVLHSTKEVCSTCFQELSSFLDFLRKCHEGQRRLLEQLTLAQKAHFDCMNSVNEPNEYTIHQQSDDNNQEERSDDEDDDEATLSEPETDETEEMKNARMDRYIDRFIAKLKSTKRTIGISKDWECLDCREIFQFRNRLAIHRRTCPLVGSKDSKRYGPFQCKFCDKVSKTLPGYRYHLLKMHDKDKIRATGTVQGKSSMVDEQDESYPDELRTLKSRKTVVCPICQDIFRTNGELRYHLYSHKSANREQRSTEGEQQPKESCLFMCNVCGKMERSNAGLEIHMKFHLKQKDWPCQQCDKEYYTKADLKQHVLTKHEKITYTCSECGTVLNSRATFTRHQRLHDESQLKRCQFCPKKFTTSNSLKKHVQNRHQGLRRQRIHDIEMPVKDDAQWEEADDGRTMDAIEQWEDGGNEGTIDCSAVMEEVVVEEIILGVPPSVLGNVAMIKGDSLVIAEVVDESDLD